MKVFYDAFHGLADADGRNRNTPSVPQHIQAELEKFNELYTSRLQPRFGRKLPSLQALCLGVRP